MWEPRPRRLHFARDGHHLALRDADRISVVVVPTMEPVAAFDVPGLADFVAVDESIWVIHGDPPQLSSYGFDGHADRESIAIPASARGTLDRAPFGEPRAMWCDGALVAIAPAASGFAVEPWRNGIDLAIPIQGDTHLSATGTELSLGVARAASWGSSIRLASGVPVAGSGLFDGRTIALLVQGDGDQQHLQVIGAREGQILHRLAVRGITAARFAASRGYAFLLGGQRTLIAVDLRFGKVIKELEEARDIIDFAVDDAAQHMALVLRDTDGRDTAVYTTYREFLAAQTAGEVDREPRAVAAAAEEEPAEERDARSRREAVAAARRAQLRSDPEPAPSGEPELPLVVPELAALRPRPVIEACTQAQALDALNCHLALVGALTERAIAVGWDSGRIAFPDDGTFPFEKETAGLLGRGIGAARDRVAAAEQSVDAAATALRRAMQGIGGNMSPLRALMQEFELSLLAAEILMVVAAPTLWGDAARLYGILCNDPERSVCDEHLIGILLGGERERRHAIARELDPDRPLVQYGLIRVGAGKGRPFLALTVDPLVIRRLRMDPVDAIPGALAKIRRADRALDELVIPRQILQRALDSLAAPAQAGGARVVVRGRLGSGRRTLLAALAAAVNRELGVIDVGLLGREPHALIGGLADALAGCVIRGWLPCIDGLHQDDTMDVALLDQLREVIRAHAGPIAFRSDWDETPPIDPAYVQIDLPPLTETQRIEHWTDVTLRHALAVSDVDHLAARFRAGPGIVERVAAEVAATVGASSPGAPRDDYPALDAAMRRHMEVRLGQVATRVPRLAGWSSVVLPDDLIDSLLELISRIRHRRTVYEEWGFDRKMTSSRGLTVLFQGPPGTGKSMVAGVIANELSLDLYRVDLSRIMSKWIGETERNLAAVFDAAEDGQAIILFDEADSLFSKRTEVRSSVDRYANLEVNYLLQRLDSFEGIAVLTTNFGGSIDRAFQRRMSLRLTFPFPDEDQREQLWRVHLPPELPTAGEFDLAGLARKYRLSGGYIRNAALRAAFLAAEERRPLTHEHLERAIRLEYREMGKLADTGVLE